jgi:mannose-6-phosphate isomerase-like protein (cupin superfamily)
MDIINLLAKFELFDDVWTPKIVGELNNQYIKLAKFEGQMVWHSHAHEDEFFHVIEGEIMIHLRDKTVTLKQGECFIVPKGVEHMPEAKSVAKVLLFEPKSTAHTGQDKTALTVNIESQQWI